MEVDQCCAAGSSATFSFGTMLPQIVECDSSISHKDRLVAILDQLENKVEKLRKEASRLEEDKDNIMVTLDTLKSSDLILDLNEFEKDDIQNYSERVQSRCQTVEISVRTTRDPTQEEALCQVNFLIDGLVFSMRHDPDGTKSRCLSFMNACSEHTELGNTDKNFETALLGCTVDDQKRIKKRLQGLLNYFDKNIINMN